MSIFVDTSAWFAAADTTDRHNSRATEILSSGGRLVTSDHVLVETWLLLHRHLPAGAAEHFWKTLRAGAARLEIVTAGDLENAWAIGEAFHDQDFSVTDRTSFAVMERLGLDSVASFDDDFAVYRYGRGRRRAFDGRR